MVVVVVVGTLGGVGAARKSLAVTASAVCLRTSRLSVWADKKRRAQGELLILGLFRFHQPHLTPPAGPSWTDFPSVQLRA